MKNLAIGLRLALSFAVMLVITLAVAASGYWGVSRVADVTREILDLDYAQSSVSESIQQNVLSLLR